MYPTIQFIPTSGTKEGVTTVERGINQLMPNIPTSRTTRTMRTGQIVRIRG
jgi:hypothetical protein